MEDKELVQLAELSKGVLSFTGLNTEHEWYCSLMLGPCVLHCMYNLKNRVHMTVVIALSFLSTWVAPITEYPHLY